MSRIIRTKIILWPFWVIPLFWVFFFSPSAFAIPMIIVTYPNGGETWEIGSTQVIQWAHSGWPGAYMKIELIRGFGVNRVLSSKTYVGDKGVGLYKWTVPSCQMLGNNFKIRVTSLDNSRYTDISDNYFTVAQAALASLQVKISNGGEIWKAGSSQTIRWTYSGKVPAMVKIELLRGSTVAGLIASGVSIGEAGQGFYPWNLPSAMVAGKDYKIRVTAEASTVNIGDMSDNYFIVEGQSSLCQAQVPADRWKGEYFNNMTLGGTPVMIRDDGMGFLNFDWAGGSPSTSCGITPDNFSTRWTRTVNFPAGSYLFTIIADDGVRFWIDGKLLLDKWIDQAPTTYTVGPLSLSAGNHTLKMEFYEKGGGATAKLSWQTASNPCQAKVTADHWMGEYFSNRDLAGTPVMIRDVGTGFLNFDWLEGSPNPSCGVPADQFSVRWTREVYLSEGKYRFTVRADDGVRLWLNGKLLLDKWIDQGPTTYTVGPLPLYEGAYPIKMEYYEMGGGATAKLSWEKEPLFALEWPNEISKANSDPWLAEHHREIKVMRPKVLALNFVNHRTMEEMKGHFQKTIQAIAESSRYHGYKNPSAPAFLQYELAFAIDLRDKPVPPGYPYRNSTRYPRENPTEGYWGFDYEKLFTPEFAVHFRIPGPNQPTRFLTLCELIDRGLVHEVWIYGDGDVPDVSAAEVLELKPRYDENQNRIPGHMSRCAGNGCFDSEDDIPCSRMVRIAIMDGPGKGENYWYARNYGWAGFGHVEPPDAPKSLFEMTHIEGIDGSVRDAQWSCSNPPNPQPVPPPSCQAGVSADRWKGEYFDNTSLSGSPKMVRDDGAGSLDFNWGEGSPNSSCGVPSDNFSVRWTRNVNFSAGTYEFTVTGDDGVRLWVGGTLLIDQWKDQGPTTYKATRPLSGTQPVKLEYYERGGGAVAKLSWTQQGSPSNLPDVVVDDLRFDPSSPQANQSVRVFARVRNQGNASTSSTCTNPGDCKIGVGFKVNGGYIGWGIRGAALGAGESADIELTSTTWRPSQNGNYTVRAEADDTNRFRESNEGNNAREETIAVGGGGGPTSPYPNCSCSPPNDSKNNYCHHNPSTPGCPMTNRGGYCDPNGNGVYDDADWGKGYSEFQQYCR